METARKKEPLIFIVEDEVDAGHSLLALLAQEGYSARLFRDPLEAARAFPTCHPMPDLLITDFEMPGLNGLELAQVCKSNHPALRVIMASGHTQEQLRRDYNLQPDLLFQKPFAFEFLLAGVRQLLGEHPQTGTGG